MGQAVADAVNVKEPTMTTEESAANVVERVRSRGEDLGANYLADLFSVD